MKYCQDCGTLLKGRTDKKFCDDYCRCHYNNELNRNRDQDFKKINNILKKNTSILEKLIEQGIKNSTPHSLSAAGFNFNFLTHQLQEQNGEMTIYCYNYGYIKINEEQLVLKQVTHPLYFK